MLDGQIVAALIAEIKIQLGLYGIAGSDLRVARNNQPTAQYAGAVPSAEKYQALISPITNTNIGWSREYGSDGEAGTLSIRHTKQKAYQISTLSDFDPATPGDIPAQDLAQIIHDMIQHPDSLKNLRAKGVYVLECVPVRPSFQINQSDEYESMPNFDIVISYNSDYTKPAPSITGVSGETAQL